jgi:uncharacterized protein (DUF2141 family)
MKVWFMAFCLTGFGLQAPAQHTLEVTVSDINVVKGSIRLALYSNTADFMKKHQAVREVAVSSKVVKVFFENLEPGEYAISCYHDVNDNKKLDANFMGIPREPYGFSNNARGTFGPPGFDDARFSVNGNTSITVRLK